MKYYGKLSGFFFRYLKWITLFSGLFAAALQLIWLWFAAKQPHNAYATYQAFVYDPQRFLSMSQLFTFSLQFFCFVIGLWLMRCFKGKRRPLYTLLTLPGPRMALPFALFTAILLSFVLFFLLECGILFAGYHVWAHQAPFAIEQYLAQLQTTDPTAYASLSAADLLPFVNNDLYLAFAHSPVGTLVLPPCASAAVYALGMLTLTAAVFSIDLFLRGTLMPLLVFMFGSCTVLALSGSHLVIGILMLAAAACALAFACYCAVTEPYL